MLKFLLFSFLFLIACAPSWAQFRPSPADGAVVKTVMTSTNPTGNCTNPSAQVMNWKTLHTWACSYTPETGVGIWTDLGAGGGTATVARSCEVDIWGSGTSGALETSDSQAASCYNASGASLTITSVKCYADNSSTTTTVTPTLTGGGSILTGALTCGNGSFATGTLSGTPTLASGSTLDATISAAGTAKSIRLVVTFQ